MYEIQTIAIIYIKHFLEKNKATTWAPESDNPPPKSKCKNTDSSAKTLWI